MENETFLKTTFFSFFVARILTNSLFWLDSWSVSPSIYYISIPAQILQKIFESLPLPIHMTIVTLYPALSLPRYKAETMGLSDPINTDAHSNRHISTHSTPITTPGCSKPAPFTLTHIQIVI